MARGGHGEKATTIESKDLDGVVAKVAVAIAQHQSKYCFEPAHSNRISSKFKSGTQEKSAVPEFVNKGILHGCRPDGGMWFTGPRSLLERLLAVAFEAKHQQNGGNANERWYKNHWACNQVSPGVQYVTFMSGKGAVEGGVLWTHAKSVEANDANAHFYLSVNGFTAKEVFDIMIKHLELDLSFDDIKDHIGVKPKTTKSTRTTGTRQKHTGANGEVKFVEHRNLFVGFMNGRVVVTRRTAEQCRDFLKAEYGVE